LADYHHLDPLGSEFDSCKPLSRGQQALGNSASLEHWLDGQQTNIGEAVPAVSDLNAANKLPILFSEQDPLRRVGQNLLKHFDADSLALDKLSLVGPALSRRIASVGAMDKLLQRTKIWPPG
jgi:hypothetical protein